MPQTNCFTYSKILIYICVLDQRHKSNILLDQRNLFVCIQNEVFIKYIGMFSYLEKFSYIEYSLIFDDFLIFRLSDNCYFGYQYSSSYSLHIKF